MRYKTCTICKVDKIIQRFGVNNAKPDRMQCHCKDCDSILRKKKREKDPVKYGSMHLKSRYGITLEQYNDIFAQQEGKCKICKKHQTQLKRKLAVDHCHTTGRVRALLCQLCNMAVGSIKEDPKIASELCRYLQEVVNAI